MRYLESDWLKTADARAVEKLDLKAIKDMAYEPGAATVQRYGWKNLIRELIRRLESRAPELDTPLRERAGQGR